MVGSTRTNGSPVSTSRTARAPGTPRTPERGRGHADERGLGVVLIDQTPLFRDGMANLITHTPGLRWLGATHNVHAAVRLIERLAPDIAIIDAGLDPRGRLSKLLTSAAQPYTVISLVRDPNRTMAYLAGSTDQCAHGVVLRSAEPAQIMEAIRRAHTDRRYLDPALTNHAPAGPNDNAASTHRSISRRECQVLQLVADGLENQAIAKALFVSVETIRTHVKSILRKLSARDRAHAVAIAFRLGILTTQHPAPAPLHRAGTDQATDPGASLRPARA